MHSVSRRLEVRIATGGLRGVDLEGLDVEAFLGIPYGAPATGAGRWAPPRPVSPWTGVRPAADPGPACPQPARPFSEWAHGPLPATDEDSLTVNVWRPAGEGPARPVLVFVHGGGWAIGWGSNALLDGRHLALALDAVVVTLNYRLGSLGWLYHPDLATSSGAPAGNWGLLDQKAALRWVADNIAAFGGDPARVTLAGESAGAGNVLHLLTDPEAAPLFARALTLSPPLHELVVDRALGERWTEALLAHLDLGDDVASGVAVLRELPAATIVATQEKLLAGEAFRGTRGGAMPIVDPASLPVDPARAPEVRPEVPLLIGTNADEGTFFFRAAGRRVDPEPAQLEAMVGRIAHADAPGELIAATRERLSGDGEVTANDVLCAIVTEAWFAGPVARYAAARAAAGAEVHRYRVEHRSPDGDLGALHTMSVPLLFASWREGGVARRFAGDGPQTEAVSAAFVADVRRFVQGEPLGWDPVPADGGAAAQVVYGGPSGARSVQ